MRRKLSSVSLNLNQAVALLIQTQTSFLARMAKADERFEAQRVQSEERFKRIEHRLDVIETILRELPQAIRREIGFKPPKS